MTTIDRTLISTLRKQADLVRDFKIEQRTPYVMEAAADTLEAQQANIEQLTIALQAETKLVREAQGDARYWRRESIRRTISERGRP